MTGFCINWRDSTGLDSASRDSAGLDSSRPALILSCPVLQPASQGELLHLVLDRCKKLRSASELCTSSPIHRSQTCRLSASLQTSGSRLGLLLLLSLKSSNPAPTINPCPVPSIRCIGLCLSVCSPDSGLRSSRFADWQTCGSRPGLLLHSYSRHQIQPRPSSIPAKCPA